MSINPRVVIVVVLFFLSTAIAQQTSSSTDVVILSDTYGYDFSRYMGEVINRVRTNWFALIPEAAREGKQGRVVVIFTIIRDGKVQDLRLVGSSNVQPLDRAAISAIELSSYFLCHMTLVIPMFMRLYDRGRISANPLRKRVCTRTPSPAPAARA